MTIIISLIVFLFTVYLLSKDDVFFIRKGVNLENIFNTVLLSLPIAFIFGRFFFILINFNIKYLNPIIFISVMYFPGLSLIGAIAGAFLFIKFYAAKKKIPSQRLFDILGVSLFVSSIFYIFLEGILFLFSNKLLGFIDIVRSGVGLIIFIFIIKQFIKGFFKEGSASYFSLISYCVVSFIYFGLMAIFHKEILLTSLLLTFVLFVVSLIGFIYKQIL